MTTTRHIPFLVDRYLVTPLIRRTEGGLFAPSVSIRSGHGQAMHDRVLRFHARFDSADGARRYAAAEGLSWVRSQQPGVRQAH